MARGRWAVAEEWAAVVIQVAAVTREVAAIRVVEVILAAVVAADIRPSLP